MASFEPYSGESAENGEMGRNSAGESDFAEEPQEYENSALIGDFLPIERVFEDLSSQGSKSKYL